MYNFGTGLLEFTPAGSNPTPVQCGVLQDVSLEASMAIKELVGQYQFPVDIAIAERKLSGKAKYATIFGAALSNILSGTLSTGSVYGSVNEAGTIPATPFAVTVANSATFAEDLGVIDVNTGLPMTRVASGPTTGQYSVAAGVYTFAAADTGHVVWISYSYTAVGGKTVLVANALMGNTPTFSMTLFNTYKSKMFGIKLYSTVIPKLAIATKNNDHTMNDLDFSAFANSSGNIASFYTTE